MYNPKVLEHYRNPRNIGEIEDADGVGVYLSDFCGDITKFWIKVKGDEIIDVKFKTQGCAASIASGSILTELAKGKTIEEVLRITKEDVAGALGGLPEQKIHCSLLATDAYVTLYTITFQRMDFRFQRNFLKSMTRSNWSYRS